MTQTTYDDPVPEYDDAYPYGEAGHAVAGPQIDSGGDFIPPRTQYGYDHGFSGEQLEEVGNTEPHSNVGYAHTNAEITRRVEETSGQGRGRVTMTAERSLYGNNTFTTGGQNYALIPKRSTRRSVTVSNQGTLIVYVGNSRDVVGSIAQVRPDCVYLPGGAARTLYTKDDIFLAGAPGAVVDWVEEVYNG